MPAAAFYPEDVTVRLSDFKTNERANLVGDRQFEPVEENPMIGFRDAFGLECPAIKQVRESMASTT